ncbi:MAG TPA: tryptophan halogenase family protein [Polyangiaceae bacterium]
MGVIGGGTAGYFAALALVRAFPGLRVTLVESSAVPIIGVGEATTTLMPPFLHQQLGLDIVELFRAVRPTFKLGIKFEWGPREPPWFAFPFGDAWPVDAFVHDGDLRRQSLTSVLMRDDRAPIVRGPEGALLSLLPSLKFAYHLENRSFVQFLTLAASRAGIEHVDATIESAVVGADGDIEVLRADDGRELRFDLYVDATGFRSLLLEKALGSKFTSYASSLFCDRAVVAALPRAGRVGPYTTAETMDAGWCWRIPVGDEDHRGYVFASAFLDEDRAVAEMRSRNPGMVEASLVRFRSGRHGDFWLRNVVAVGNAYGFVEPLESTALHMVIVELAYLLEGLRLWRDEGQRSVAYTARASQAVGEHWDYLRWFLAIHYRFNERLDTPFWRAARADVDVSGVSDALARFRAEGTFTVAGASPLGGADPGFRADLGATTLLLGQRAEGCAVARAAIERRDWEALVSRHEGLAARALDHGEALDALLATPRMVEELVSSPTSWLHREGRLPAELARAS